MNVYAYKFNAIELEVVVSYHSNEDYATIFFRDSSKGIGTISTAIEGTSIEVSKEFAINLYLDFRNSDAKVQHNNKQHLVKVWQRFVRSHKMMLDNLNQQ